MAGSAGLKRVPAVVRELRGSPHRGRSPYSAVPVPESWEGGGRAKRRRRLGLPHPVFVSFFSPRGLAGSGSCSSLQVLAGFCADGRPSLAFPCWKEPLLPPHPKNLSLFLPAPRGRWGIRLPKCVTRSSGCWGLCSAAAWLSPLPPSPPFYLAGSRHAWPGLWGRGQRCCNALEGGLSPHPSGPTLEVRLESLVAKTFFGGRGLANEQMLRCNSWRWG